MMASLLCYASSLMSAQTRIHGEKEESTIIIVVTFATSGNRGEGELMDETSRRKMALAFQVAAGKVEKKEKKETNGEMHKRIMEEKEAKLNRGVKKAARTMVKKKEIKKLTAYFGKK